MDSHGVSDAMRGKGVGYTLGYTAELEIPSDLLPRLDSNQ
ncbi:hypothetical protein PROPHIGD68-1_1 [Mycobacterium phage prophi68-1]|nr:hypothetical protein PROPHIGD68-1_1 [Mycobacterium phage prophi68-1]QSM05024.1 hypothetical protein PROPHIGD04-1_1 [Mycobacterium phage prophiGD04-1]